MLEINGVNYKYHYNSTYSSASESFLSFARLSYCSTKPLFYNVHGPCSMTIKPAAFHSELIRFLTLKKEQNFRYPINAHYGFRNLRPLRSKFQLVGIFWGSPKQIEPRFSTSTLISSLWNAVVSRASNFSAHRHRWKLIFSDNLFLILTKTAPERNFENLSWRRF